MVDKIIKVLFLMFIMCIVYALTTLDNNAPEITINNQLSKTFLIGSPEPSWANYVTVTDDIDGELDSNQYSINTSDVDFNKQGKQEVVYTATDSSGNKTKRIMKINVSSGYKHASFESFQDGTAFTRDQWEKEGFVTDNWDNGLEKRTKIVSNEAANGDKSLEVIYPKGNYGSEATGAQVGLHLVPNDEYYSSYKVKFDEDFSWGSENKGGKLPGLTGGDKCGDDFICDGTDGFSARYMWRDDGYPELYLYSADMENVKYGDDIPFESNGKKFQFERGKWYTITQHVKLNSTPLSDDGVIEIWVNGEQVLKKDDITFVTDDQLIDTFYFSTFFGGHDATWQPEHTSKAYFDEIKISIDPREVDFN